MSRRANPDQGPMPMGGPEAARFGEITTFENAAGKRLVIHRAGSTRVAVRSACDAARRLDDSFRIVCISTPNTIHTDLQGARRHTGRAGCGTLPARPELMLGRDLRTMLHPALTDAR